jgi:hypothetical protein
MMSRRSSGSILVASSVEATRSQNRIESWRRSTCGDGRRRDVALAERGDGAQQFAPVADRGDTKIGEIVGSQCRQHLIVDVVIVEGGRILFEAEAAQPVGNVHRHETVPGPRAFARE